MERWHNYACKNIHNLQFLMMQDSPAILTFQPGRSGHTIRNPNFGGSISEDSILRLLVTVDKPDEISVSSDDPLPPIARLDLMRLSSYTEAGDMFRNCGRRRGQWRAVRAYSVCLRVTQMLP